MQLIKPVDASPDIGLDFSVNEKLAWEFVTPFSVPL